MGKHQKNVLAVLLTVAMCLSQSVPAFADELLVRNVEGTILEGYTESDMTKPVPGKDTQEEIAVEEIDDITTGITIPAEGNADSVSGNFYYQEIYDGTIEITEYKGDESGDLIIPASINGIQVTSIGYSAFEGRSGFTGTLTIPDSVINIGSSAFEGCSGFTGVLTIPDGVTTIEDSTFKNCSGFTGALTIPDSVRYIGSSAFEGCSGFTGELVLPNDLYEIGASAFEGCSGFTGELVLPNDLYKIGASAFEGCSGFSMKDLLMPEQTWTIGDRAFAGCIGIKGAMAFPTESNSFSFGNDILANTDMVGPIHISTDDNEGFTIIHWLKNEGELKIPATIKGMKLKAISNGAFISHSGFTGDLIIPKGVESIGICAFQYCTGFDGKLVIPEGVTYIGVRAFDNCTGLKGKLTLPQSLEAIETSAFDSCSGLSGDLIIPERVKTIDTGAFSRCSGFGGSLTIPGNVEEIGPIAFNGCSGLSGDLIISEGVKSIDAAVFSGTSFTGRLVIPESLTKMNSGAFTDCQGFKEIDNRSNQKIISVFFLSDETEYLLSDNGIRVSYGEYIGKGKYIKCAEVDGVSLDRESVSLAVGESTALTATVTPANAGNKDVTWIVGDPGIATVSNGVITGVSAGSTVVTVSTNEAGYTASCNVTVTDGGTIPGPDPGPDPEPDPKPVPDPQIKTYTVTFKDGDTVFDTQTVKAGDTASEPASKPSRKDSIFIGWAYGSSIWNFTTPINKDLILIADYKAEKVNTNDNSGSGKDKQPVIKEGSLYLVKGQSYTAGGEGWSSDNESVASVAADSGKITAKGAGKTTVKNAAVSYTVYVAEPQMTQSSKNISVIVGNSAEAELNLNAVSGTEGSYPVTWYSSNTKVAVVNNGTVTGVAKGSAKITAYVGGKAYTTKVKVTDTFKAPSKFAAKDAEFNMNPLQTFALKFDKEVFSVKGAVWSGDGMRESEDGTGYENKTVRITAAGKITAIGAGTTLITGKDKKGREASVKVTVVPVASKKAVYITKGKSETVKFPKVSNKKAESFSSSDEKVATVDRKGRVKGIGYGTSVISCTYKGFTFTTTVYVEEPEIRFDGVKYESGAEITMKSGEMKQLKIDKTEQTLDYKSSKAAVAFIDENGFVYARKPGMTNISVKINGKKYLIKLEVE